MAACSTRSARMLRPRSAPAAAVLISDLLTCWANSYPASPARRTLQVTPFWMLTTTMHRLMRTPDARVEPTRAAVARVMRSAPTGSHNSTTVQHKDRDRAVIAYQLAAFKRAGGKVEILGNTPVRQELSRRQINDVAAASRAGTRH